MASNPSSERMMQKWSQTDTQWLSFPAHGSSVVTCLLLSHNRIITASTDRDIHVYSPVTGELQLRLEGHDGGVWSIVVAPNSPKVLVSGSTDCTIRIWDLSAGKCTHIFGAHTSTIRCLEIVQPVWLDIGGRREKWPKRSLVVSGSRDHTDKTHDPYYLRVLAGHTHAVRDLAAHGRTAVSASYDTTLKVWDIITGQCTWTLQGHSQKVYSVILDHERNQVISGSMDGTARIWSLATGQTTHILEGHSSLVGLLSLSPSYLVTASSDSTICVYGRSDGTSKHKLATHTGAITCFQADEYKVVSGSDGELILWDIREGKIIRKMLTGVTGVWQVAFGSRWCVAAFNRNSETYLGVWDFGIEGEENDQMESSEDDGSEDERIASVLLSVV
ncbi:cell division control protein 4 [Ceratobasidium sp. AG-I]|nr:cell division control protein 4 [Ceratobasidium sp. AG-I]